MKSKALFILFAAGCAFLVYCVFMPSPWDVTRERIYDESADGTRQVADALIKARQEHKFILLQFGANWCVPCHLLHSLYSSDPAVKNELEQHYLVVLIDVNHDHNAPVVKQYGNPTDLGLPVLVVLDADGHQLATQGTDGFVNATEDEFDAPKLLALLKKWSASQ